MKTRRYFAWQPRKISTSHPVSCLNALCSLPSEAIRLDSKVWIQFGIHFRIHELFKLMTVKFFVCFANFASPSEIHSWTHYWIHSRAPEFTSVCSFLCVHWIPERSLDSSATGAFQCGWHFDWLSFAVSPWLPLLGCQSFLSQNFWQTFIDRLEINKTFERVCQPVRLVFLCSAKVSSLFLVRSL